LTRKLYYIGIAAALPAALVLTVVVRTLIAFYGSEFEGSWVTSAIAGTWGSLLLFNGLLTTNAITHSRRAYLWVASFQGLRSLAFIAIAGTLVWVDQLSVRTMLATLAVVELMDSANLVTINRKVVCAEDAT
jgi:hypothetical protein